MRDDPVNAFDRSRAREEVVMGGRSIEELIDEVWRRFNREVSISFKPAPPGNPLPWSVMVEGDVGSYGGSTLVDALEHRLEGGPPEKEQGWGASAT